VTEALPTLLSAARVEAMVGVISLRIQEVTLRKSLRHNECAHSSELLLKTIT
jgi:hypothetical protein